MIGMTPARRRVLLKAHKNGSVMRAGGFGDGSGGAQVMSLILLPIFDRCGVIDRLIAAGLMAAGEGYNTAVLTDQGRAVVERLRVKEAVA